MGDLLCLSRSLYSQSYAAIAHTFVDSITAYQELQRKYERLLEKNYEQPAFFEETTPPADSPSSGPIVSFSSVVDSQQVGAHGAAPSSLKPAWKASCSTESANRVLLTGRK